MRGRNSTLLVNCRREFPATTDHEDGFTVRCSLLNMAIAHKHGCVFGEELLEEKRRLQEPGLYTGELPSVLLPYQVEGVRKLAGKSGALLADEQGLGKTLQIITTLAIKDMWPAVVYCPAHLKHTWAREFDKWRPEIGYTILNGRTPDRIVGGRVFICNYEIAQYWVDELNRHNPRIVVCDEAHRIQNRKTISAEAVEWTGDDPQRYMVTGTPLTNSPADLWSLMDMIEPGILGARKPFMEYAAIVRKQKIRVRRRNSRQTFTIHVDKVVGVKNDDVVRKTIASSRMIRRTKAEVLSQLPDKIQTVVPVAVSCRDSVGELVRRNTADGIAIERSYAEIRRELGLAKTDAAVQWESDFGRQCDRQLIIAVWHRDVAEKLQAAIKNSVMVVGGDGGRQGKIDSFVAGRYRVLIGNIKAIGTGLTLTNASDILFVELPATAADLAQMADRIHRIGQKRTCNYYFLVGMDTIEERITAALVGKANMAGGMLDGETIESFDELLEG